MIRREKQQRVNEAKDRRVEVRVISIGQRSFARQNRTAGTN